MRLRWWWILLAPLMAGCAVGAAEIATSNEILVTPTPVPEVTPTLQPIATATSGPQIGVPSAVPDVDVTKHSVLLDDVYFDTFQLVNRAVPLSQAVPELI
jgi:hypothetical protein